MSYIPCFLLLAFSFLANASSIQTIHLRAQDDKAQVRNAQSSTLVSHFAGRPEYSVIHQIKHDRSHGDRPAWFFYVYVDEWHAWRPTKPDKPRFWGALDVVAIHIDKKIVAVEQALNHYDDTQDPLELPQIIKACWTLTKWDPSEFWALQASDILNWDFQEAAKFCRSRLNLWFWDSFTLNIYLMQEGSVEKACWDRLIATGFAKIANGTIGKFDIDKGIVEFRVHAKRKFLTIWGDDVTVAFKTVFTSPV